MFSKWLKEIFKFLITNVADILQFTKKKKKKLNYWTGSKFRGSSEVKYFYFLSFNKIQLMEKLPKF